jgi:hypothetical protein
MFCPSPPSMKNAGGSGRIGLEPGDTGTILFSYCHGCRNGAHSFNHDLTRADSRAGAADGCPMYFVNSWVLGWSSDQRD